MAKETTRNVYLTSRPQGRLRKEDFEVREEALEDALGGHVRVRTLYLSIDASNRYWMHGDSAYHRGVTEGTPMQGRTLGVVERCAGGEFKEGDIVEGDWGWRERANPRARTLMKRAAPPSGTPTSYLTSVFGISGLTGYFGVTQVGEIRAGEVLAVSAAAGAAGSYAAQIGKIAGARVIGFAGGKEKTSWLRNDLGLDEALDRREDGFEEKVSAALGEEGADVYFDNVGGETLEMMLPRVRVGGRIVCCGAISIYDTDGAQSGPRGVPGLVVTRRLRMQGFIVLDYASQFARAREILAGWIADGRLKVREDITEGLENAPQALVGLLSGDNIGKRLVRVDKSAR